MKMGTEIIQTLVYNCLSDIRSEETEKHKCNIYGHKCESCGKSFSQAGHLKTHINRIHGLPLKLNQQNFDFTTSGFNNEDNNDIEEFKCQLCHCQFMTEKSLKIHVHHCKIEFMTEKSLEIHRYQFK